MNTNLKIKRIKTLIQRLQLGKNVSLTSISRVISNESLENFKDEWRHEVKSRKAIKPLAIIKYEKMIKVACLHYSRMERYLGDLKKPKLASIFAHKADNAFELALEYLTERIESEPDLIMWIDRDIKEANYHPAGIPRVIGSSSFECQIKRKTPFPTLTKRELKLQALELALSDLEIPVLESFCETEKTVHFPLPKKREMDFSSFKF